MNAMENKLEIPLKKVIKKGGINEKRPSGLEMGEESDLSQACAWLFEWKIVD
ncbi:hypothetical protein [Bacillus salipaludis]|uniref:Uncharacterized protein n=2 Tax=Bacillus salipaludis TaxID=2547811 RepID=A0AA90QRE3_9BACI|nr:hypothetical protein [Bacillus salipaludis]MDQ6595114.1 hypothetical protein [Bacillus salipaludis]